jgi:hypothetical protein
MLGYTRVPWHTSGNVIKSIFPKSVEPDKRVLFFFLVCFGIVIFTSTDELRVPQFVDLT